MLSVLFGLLIYFTIRCILTGFYTVDQNERAVITSFGKAKRLGQQTTSTLPLAEHLSHEEKALYDYPVLDVVGPGLHFKMPWEKVHKVSIATETINMAYDPEHPSANRGGQALEAVTRDQLNIALKGQIRFRIAEKNLYAYFFGVRSPLVHIMGYFSAVLRERIANFETSNKAAASSSEKGVDPQGSPQSVLASQAGDIHIAESVSINDLRKNLPELNDLMIRECQTSAARYGIELESSLITGIEPPHEVESALAAINTAYNNVSSEISLAKATADQTIVQSKKAVEIETLKVQAELEPLVAMSREMRELKKAGPHILQAYVRNVRLAMLKKVRTAVVEK